MRKLTKTWIIALVIATPAASQTPEQLIAVRYDFANALDAHNLDLVMSYFAEDAVYDFVPSPVPICGKPDIRIFFEDFLLAFPDIHTVEERVFATGNIVVVELRLEGTHGGDWKGNPPTGKSVSFSQIDIYEFETDKIKRLTSYVDMAGPLTQVLALSAPEVPLLVPSFRLPYPESTGLSPLQADVQNIALWNDRDLVNEAKMFHADAITFVGPLDTVLDRDAVIALNESYFQGFSDIQIEAVRRVDLGDGWVLLEEVYRGTHDGPFFGVSASGNSIQVRVALLTHYDADGLIAYQGRYYDLLTILAQIQAPQEPPGMVFVDIPRGTFDMGDHFGSGPAHERPVHTVTVSSFRLSKYEVTNAQYAEYLNSAMAYGLITIIDGVVFASPDEMDQPFFRTPNVQNISQISFGGGEFTVRSRNGLSMADHPVVAITWYGAKAFCDYYGYRLPTEAEWEYAARGGFHSPYFKYPWGSNSISTSQSNYDGVNPLGLGAPKTTPVGYYPAYGYGLCDMAGNVIEWCQDWWGQNYYGGSSPQDPDGPPDGTARVLRGGSWFLSAGYSRVTSRGSRTADWSCPLGVNGFRPAMDVSDRINWKWIGPELIAHWKLDEAQGATARDSVNGNDDYVLGFPTRQPTGGKVDGAIQFDGFDDFITTTFALNPVEGPFSIFAWIKGGAPGQVIVSGTGGSDWLMVDAGGKLTTELSAPDPSGTPLLSEAVIGDGLWHHIGLIWDGSNRMLYVDDAVVAQDTQDGLGGGAANHFYIGTGKAITSGTYFSGMIDDVRIYNQAVKP